MIKRNKIWKVLSNHASLVLVRFGAIFSCIVGSVYLGLSCMMDLLSDLFWPCCSLTPRDNLTAAAELLRQEKAGEQPHFNKDTDNTSSSKNANGKAVTKKSKDRDKADQSSSTTPSKKNRRPDNENETTKNKQIVRRTSPRQRARALLGNTLEKHQLNAVLRISSPSVSDPEIPSYP
jgi:hypothetical protein